MISITATSIAGSYLWGWNCFPVIFEEPKELECGSPLVSEIDLRYLRFFIAVAEEMNFSRAAERLHTVQPSLSRQIRRLEEIVGTPLFNRDRHKLTLTGAGQVFLGQSRIILDQINHAIAFAQQKAREDAGQITIGFILGTESQLFPRLVPALRKRYPDIKLSYRALTEVEQIAALEGKTIHAGFLAGPIDNPAISTELIMHQRMIVALPANHPLARLKRIPVHRLAEFPLVPPTAVDSNYITFINQLATNAGVKFKHGSEHDNVLSALISLSVEDGACLVLDYHRAIFPKGVVARPLDLDPQPSFDLMIAYNKDDITPALASFLSVVRESMSGIYQRFPLDLASKALAAIRVDVPPS